jgi:hypothetical protein
LKNASKDVMDWMLHPREAVLWLLSMPKRRHLVPESLRGFIEGKQKKPEEASKPNVPGAVMRDFMTEEEKRLGKAPLQNELEGALRRAFPDHEVSRKQVRDLHKKTYGLKRGPRGKRIMPNNYAK